MNSFRKIVSITLLFISSIMIGQGVSANVEKNNNWYKSLPEIERENSIYRLEELDIVRKPFERWGEENYITRRDVFKIAYIVKNGDRKLYENGENGSESILKIENWKNQNFWLQTEYVDVEKGSFDYYLIYSLLRVSLISGEPSENGHVANFDTYATYEDALTVIGRLFDDPNLYAGYYQGSELVDKTQKHPYYTFATNIGLINSTSLTDPSSPQITPEQLDDSITAFEYLHLLYRALYIPFVCIEDYNISVNCHYIDNFSAQSIEENATLYEDIVD